MKHLKIFENQSNNRFEKFINDKYQIFKDINEYFNELNPKITVETIEISDIDFWRRHKTEFEIEIHYVDTMGENETIVLKNEEAQDLIDFINNPELYRSAKKYNL